MRFLGVDLASRCSAYVLLDSGGQVLEQGDSSSRSEEAFVTAISRTSFPDALVVVEDLPHHIPFRVPVKEVLRLQGRLIHEFESNHCLDNLVWLSPAVWQQSYDGVWRQGEKGAREVAEALGYSPPNLLECAERFPYKELKGKERIKIRETAKKLMTDYVDAYLIAEWARQTYAEHGTLLVNGVQKTFWRS